MLGGNLGSLLYGDVSVMSKNISKSVLKVESDIEMTIAKLTNTIMHYIFL